MLSFLYVYSDHSILECYNLFSGVELSMRSFFVISEHHCSVNPSREAIFILSGKYKRFMFVHPVRGLTYVKTVLSWFLLKLKVVQLT